MTIQRTGILVALCCAMILALQPAMAQDNPPASDRQSYSSYGVQFSLASGWGLTYGKFVTENTRLRVAAGAITTESTSYYSVGFDVQYALARNTNFLVLVGPSLGVFGFSDEETKTRIALTTCLEVPITGSTFFKNISAGVMLHYPTYYFVSKTLNPAIGGYLVYNF